jgi:NAD(P)-dependent dehydrogenase (short-subunit alcohol dehydrogenase family)
MTEYDDTAVPDFKEMLNLDGRRFVVVGAGIGMGRHTAHALRQAGAQVACIDIIAERAISIAAEIGGVACVGDATRRDDAERMVEEARRAMGGIDGLVDIVGQARYAPALEIDDGLFDWEIDVCLRHAYLFGQLVGRLMVDNGGGSMVFIASVSGLSSAPRHAAYGMAKAGLMAWVKSLAVELGPHGVRVNGLAPGAVWTPRNAVSIGEAGRDREIARTPTRSIGMPSDIAAGVLFLSSDLAAFVNGQTLIVDGGVQAKFPYEFDL